jgi:hypothetical protein
LGGDRRITWLTVPFWNNFFLMVVLIWIQTGFAMVILSAALRGIPEETVEAAIVDGANPFQIFFKIKVPQIMGTIVVVWTTITIVVLKVFDIVFAMTNGQWETQVLANYMYDKLFRANDWGVGRPRDRHHAAGDADPDLERLQRPQGDALRGGHGQYRRHQILADLGRAHLGRGAGAALADPDAGPLVSSFRTADQIRPRAGGRRCSRRAEPDAAHRVPTISARVQRAGSVIEGNLFEGSEVVEARGMSAPDHGWGTSAREIDAFAPARPPIWAMARP